MNIAMNVALPCRISVYEDGGQTRIGMVRPTVLLATLSDSEELKAIAEEVEADTIRIVDAAKSIYRQRGFRLQRDRPGGRPAREIR